MMIFDVLLMIATGIGISVAILYLTFAFLMPFAIWKVKKDISIIREILEVMIDIKTE